MNTTGIGPQTGTWCSLFELNCIERVDAVPPRIVESNGEFNLSFAKLVQSDSGGFEMEVDGLEIYLLKIRDRIREINPTAKICITLGGTGDEDSFLGAAKDRNFPLEVVYFLQKYQLDGLNIDWEKGVDKQALAQLCANLSRPLQLAQKTLTLCTWPGGVSDYYDPQLETTTDGLYVMSYGPECDIKITMQEYLDNGFHPCRLGGAIITEGGDDIADTLGPGGSINAKANFLRQFGYLIGLSWRIDNDSCNEKGLPTGERSEYFNKCLQGTLSKKKFIVLSPSQVYSHSTLTKVTEQSLLISQLFAECPTHGHKIVKTFSGWHDHQYPYSAQYLPKLRILPLQVVKVYPQPSLFHTL